ncbi:MAG TPA: hypothetical protein VK689_03600 [Armatimonadota bacterium]|nr:hypothetical protein [Armatimonadota bacterium]
MSEERDAAASAGGERGDGATRDDAPVRGDLLLDAPSAAPAPPDDLEIREGALTDRRAGVAGDDRPLSHVPDSTGQLVATEPEFAGTLAGNTTGAGACVPLPEEREPTELTEDLGPEGTVVQELGGEARH